MAVLKALLFYFTCFCLFVFFLQASEKRRVQKANNQRDTTAERLLKENCSKSSNLKGKSIKI